MERELTAAEKAQFFKERFGVGPGEMITERFTGGFVVSVGGRPAGWLREYRSADRAAPAPSLALALARIDALIARSLELDKLGY